MYIYCQSRRNNLKRLFLVVIALGFFIQGFVYLTRGHFFHSGKDKPSDMAVSLEWTSPVSSSVTFEAGLLNSHIWHDVCFTNLRDLCLFPLFPNAPDERKLVQVHDALEMRQPQSGSAQRVFGFLVPRAAGKYTFDAEFTGAVQLWLSLGPSSGRNSDSVAFSGLVTRTQAWTVDLLAGQMYFIDFIAMANTKETSCRVRLRLGTRPEYTDWTMVYPVLNDTDLGGLKTYDETIPQVRECPAAKDPLSSSIWSLEPNSSPFLEHTAVEDVLPTCRYDPSYTFHREIEKWEAVSHHVVHTFRYPFPHLDLLKDHKQWIFPLAEREALAVVELYLEKLEVKYPGKYRLLTVRNIERKEDSVRGERYLVELQLLDAASGEAVALSEYVFQARNESHLCYPEGFQWSSGTQVYLVVTAKDEGRWMYHFIKNVEKIFKETGDSNLHVVVFDYESQDIDVERVLRESSVASYRVIKKPGRYSRTEAFTEAIASIPDPHAIVFMVDLHLDIHSSFIEEIRKHCIEGRAVYTPILVRLECGALPSKPRGFWGVYGYGLIGLFKSDWDRVGGFPVQKHRWGGEDWELMDQLVGRGLEFERMRCPLLYHYYHSKKGMWSKDGK